MSVANMITRRDFDVLAPGLDVVFCGINPPPGALEAGGHSFANPSNRFWRVMHLAGFTAVRLRPEEERKLLDYRVGITAVVLRPTRTAAEVTTAEFRAARPELEAKMTALSPRVVAFLGRRAYTSMLRKPDVEWGRQPEFFAGRPAWVLPNTSGLVRISLDGLVEAYGELHQALARGEID